MKKIMRWSIVLTLSAALAGASTPLIVASAKPDLALTANSMVNQDGESFDPFTYLPIEQRLAKLVSQANQGADRLANRLRARLAIADIYLNNGQPKEAIAAITLLENKYLLLADYILLKRAQAQTQLRDLAAAKMTWQSLVEKYPDSPAAAEALFALGQTQQLLQKFPAHPRSRDVALRMLAQNPKQIEPMLLMATYFGDSKEIVPILDRLVASGSNLTADQWRAIADAYYYKFEFSKAAKAYTRSPVNPIAAYNYGRSLHRHEQFDAAIAAYKQVIQQFPNSPQAPRALIRLTQLESPQQAIAAADRLIANYPDTAAEALAVKASILEEKLASPKAASEARNLLIERYGNSNEANQLRWRIAKGLANSGQIAKAIATVDSLIAKYPSGSYAAESAFWAGKWADQMGNKAKAKQLFEFTLRQHPDSYYAWRSATSLGWQVGTFTTARYVAPAIVIPSQRTLLPAGSPKLQELYQLGLDREAYAQWSVEIAGKRDLSPKEIFTDGVLRVAIQDNLMGIRILESLDWIDVDNVQKAEIAQLKEHPAYLRSLYPFHYWDLISQWSQERKISPALVIGLMRQESRFEPRIRSSVGAVGLMQIMPETGAWIAVQKGIKKYNLDNPTDNISFGTWYLNYTHSSYGDNSVLAIASYNAGPGAVGRWVQERRITDSDEFVNSIPYEETRDYVSKVLGNYWNYLRLYSPTIQQQITALQ
ncbi:MAG: lytic transglycosylase [Oscillatoriales cyanobacterium CG2_30_44_21]|nr:MAG: lytic transglycosylase [Oscillatoriales cyanobacterium CG2_30_44_21]